MQAFDQQDDRPQFKVAIEFELWGENPADGRAALDGITDAIARLDYVHDMRVFAQIVKSDADPVA